VYQFIRSVPNELTASPTTSYATPSLCLQYQISPSPPGSRV
jgi:hypothetical protein